MKHVCIYIEREKERDTSSSLQNVDCIWPHFSRKHYDILLKTLDFRFFPYHFQVHRQLASDLGQAPLLETPTSGPKTPEALAF